MGSCLSTLLTINGILIDIWPQLYLAGNSLGPAGGCALFSGLALNTGLRHIYLVSHRIIDDFPSYALLGG